MDVKLKPYDRLVGSLLLYFQVNGPSRLGCLVQIILAPPGSGADEALYRAKRAARASARELGLRLEAEVRDLFDDAGRPQQRAFREVVAHELDADGEAL